MSVAAAEAVVHVYQEYAYVYPVAASHVPLFTEIVVAVAVVLTLGARTPPIDTPLAAVIVITGATLFTGSPANVTRSAEDPKSVRSSVEGDVGNETGAGEVVAVEVGGSGVAAIAASGMVSTLATSTEDNRPLSSPKCRLLRNMKIPLKNKRPHPSGA